MKDFRKMWAELGTDLELHDQLMENQSSLHKRKPWQTNCRKGLMPASPPTTAMGYG